MANRFVNPFPQFIDSTPEVRNGAKLFFYQSGTSTKLDTYSDASLSTANSNPVLLNSAGYPASSIFLKDQDYRVVLAPSTDSDPPTSAIWTADPVKARDGALIVKTNTGSGSPNGVVAGTAASSGVIPDMYWDYTNNILYVCTTTGVAAAAVWTAINASASTPAVPAPQGRLTMTSATPVLASSVTAGTAVYYTPYVGNLVPIYNGASMIPTEFSELTLTLVASHTAGSIYDVFVFSNSGVMTLATGPVWTTLTAGSGARGTGSSTTELTRIKGLWVNAVAMTGRNGSTTYTIGANLATYVGSIYMDGTNGQLSCLLAYGQSRKWGVWNAYNRKPIILQMGDATASWTYGTATIRQANGAATNVATSFCGLPEEVVTVEFVQRAAFAMNTTFGSNGIGVNSTTVYSGKNSAIGGDNAGGTQEIPQFNTHAKHFIVPAIGIQNINALEYGTGTGSITFYGGNDDMLLTAQWQG